MYFCYLLQEKIDNSLKFKIFVNSSLKDKNKMKMKKEKER